NLFFHLKIKFMSVNLDAGKPITALQADHYLKKYVAIRENLQKSSMPLKKPTTGTQSQQREIDDVNIFYQSDVNAFIFSKELIERFFSSEKKADYLMVILAAKYEGKEQGNPTVVVAGVNKKSDGKGYKSLSI